MRSTIRTLAACGALVLAVSPVAAQGVFDMGVLTNTMTISRGAPASARGRTGYTPGERAISNLSRYADGVAVMFRNQSGRDLRAMTLTDAGFSRKG